MKGEGVASMLVLTLLLCGGAVMGYPAGPPLDACGHMFPVGHNANAMSITPPYTLTASTPLINLTAGATVTLTLQATESGGYYEGMFVQARRASCQDEDPLGSFTIPSSNVYLQLMKCNSSASPADNAVAHKNSNRQTNITFNWIVPAQYLGRIYFRATVVKSEKTFWTNVFSDYLTYSNDTTARPTAPCPVQTSSARSVSLASAMTVVILSLAAFLSRL